MNTSTRLTALALLLTAPLLLGARGCIDELAVGVRDLSPDASVEPDAGLYCCGTTAPPPIHCGDGTPREPRCLEEDVGFCYWQYDECPFDPNLPDGSIDIQLRPVCLPDACSLTLAWDQAGFTPAAPVCADGQEAICDSTNSGLCGYQCPKGGSCSLQENSCGTSEFCAFNLGTCGHLPQPGFCQPKPKSCPETKAPVCGCDGRTYNNACEAFRAGVSVSFDAPCDVTPAACASECDAIVDLRTAKRETCADGVRTRGLQCLQKPDGSCGYQWLECPSEGSCEPRPAQELEPGQCWNDADCKDGARCQDALICPCGTSCFGADQPGTCTK